MNYKGSAVFTKQDKNEQLLEGAQFEVFQVIEDGEDVALDGFVESDKEGQVSIDQLSPGEYYLLERRAPHGHVLNTDPLPFTIPNQWEGQPDEVVIGEYINYRGSASLMKVDHDGQPLAGVTFDVINEAQEVVQTGLVSNAEGIVRAEELAPGTYSFVETSSAQGHIVNTTPWNLQF